MSHQPTNKIEGVYDRIEDAFFPISQKPRTVKSASGYDLVKKALCPSCQNNEIEVIRILNQMVCHCSRCRIYVSAKEAQKQYEMSMWKSEKTSAKAWLERRSR